MHFDIGWASLVAQRVKHLPAMRETRVRSLGQEEPLEKFEIKNAIMALAATWMDLEVE